MGESHRQKILSVPFGTLKTTQDILVNHLIVHGNERPK